MEDNEFNTYSKILGIDKKDISNIEIIRKAFRVKTLDPSVYSDRRSRILLNRAYSRVCAVIYKSKVTELDEMIIEGHIDGLKKKLKENKKILNEKINQYPPIYLAVRCGHYDIVEFFLKAGCSLNFKGDRSTPMHCAAYYGYHSIIPLLFMYGIPTDIKNVFDHFPYEEASSKKIERLLEVVKDSKIQSLHEKLLKQDIGVAIINIQDRKSRSVFLKKLIHKNYYQYWNHKHYDDAYHGTHVDNLYSIMKNGLRKPGDKVEGTDVKVVQGHITLGHAFQGKKDWSKAIFLSPSIYYSAHPVYAKEFIDAGKEVWLPLLQTKVKKGSYSRHDHTLKAYDIKNSEPEFLQFRVRGCADEKDLIIRSQQVQTVFVVATLFIKKGFLDQNENYQEVSELILNSREERHFRNHSITT